MAGKLAASILVKLIDGVSGPAAKSAKAIREIESAAKRLKGLGGKMDFKVGAGGAKSLDAMTRSAGKLTRELQAASKAAAGIRIGGMSSPFGAMRRDLAGVLGDLRKVKSASAGIRPGRGGGYGGGGYGPLPGPYGRRRGRYRQYDGDHEGASYIGVRVAGAAGRGAGNVASFSAKAGANAMREEARDFLAGVTEPDSDRLGKKAQQLSAQYPSVDATTLHNMLRDTSMSMGSTDKALENGQTLGKTATVLQSTQGTDKAINQVRQFYSALDVLGKNLNPKQVEKLADGYVKALGVEGLEMDMGKLLTFAKNAKAGGAALDDKFLMSTVPALMQDLGHHQIGTALSSMVGQIIGGRGTKKSAAYQQELGMRDARGRIPDADKKMITENPFEYVTKKLIPLLEKKGISPDDDTKVVEAMSKAFSNSRVGDLFTKMITQRGQYERKQEQYEKAPGLTAADSLKTRDPYVALGGVKAQATNLAAEAVKPYVPAATEAMNAAAKAISGTTSHLAENPETARAVTPVAAALGASLTAYLTGKTLLAAAASSNGLFSGLARLVGGGLKASGTAGGVVAPIAAATVGGAVAQESDAKSAGWLRSLITGEDTALQRTVKELTKAREEVKSAATASSILRGRTSDFKGRAGSLGDATDPFSSSYEKSRGGLGDFLYGRKKTSAELPGFGFLGRESASAGPPRRPTDFGGTDAPSFPRAAATASEAAPSVDASKIVEATAALAVYKAELVGIEQQLSGLQASGEGAFSPELPSLEGRKAELESLVEGTKAKLDELSSMTVAPKGDGSALAPIDAAADATRAKLDAVSSTTVAPKGDPSGLQTLNSLCDQILGKMAKIGSEIASKQAAATGLTGALGSAGKATPASGASAAARMLDRSSQTSMVSSPV